MPHESAAVIVKLNATVERQQQRINQLESALKPFSEIGRSWQNANPYEWTSIGISFQVLHTAWRVYDYDHNRNYMDQARADVEHMRHLENIGLIG